MFGWLYRNFVKVVTVFCLFVYDFGYYKRSVLVHAIDWNYLFFSFPVMIYQLRGVSGVTTKTNNIFTVVYVTTFMPLQKMACPTMPLPSYQKMDYYLMTIRCVSQVFHPTWNIACIISPFLFSNINILIDSGYINERKLISSDWYTSTTL